MSPATIVTCFYDVNQPHSCKHLLMIPCPMIIFVNNKNDEGFVKQHRRFPTSVVYAVFQKHLYMKMECLHYAVHSDFFDTDIFFWMDADLFQHATDDILMDLSVPWPDPTKMILFYENQLVIPFVTIHEENNSNTRFQTYAFGGNKKAISKAYDAYVDLFNDNDSVVYNDDQMIHQMIAKRHSTLYRPLRRRDDGRLTFVYDFAYKTLILSIPSFPLNHELITVGYVSKEISLDHISLWWESGHRLGYLLRVLGRQDAWINFSQKIQSIYHALYHYHAPYVLITDTTDVFFTDSAHRLLQDFKDMKKDIVIGVENQMYYNYGHHPKSVMKDFFIQLSQEQPHAFHKFVNGGLIMGKREKLLLLFQTIYHRVDDQAAYMDYIYETRDPSVALDYETKLFGNLPRYKPNHPSYSYFEYDATYKRFKNSMTNHFPSVFHFPGKNDTQRKSMYHQVFLNHTPYCALSKRFVLWFSVFMIFLLIVYLIMIRILRSTSARLQ